MDAVKRGDMETAQRMVDAAARAAGYIYRVFHGTNGPMFRQFSKDMGGAKTGAESAQLGIFATDNRKVAQSYADNPGMGSMFDLALGGPLSELRKQAYETGRGKELKDAYDASKREYDARTKSSSPLNTDSTIISARVPTATPTIEMLAMILIMLRLFLDEK